MAAALTGSQRRVLLRCWFNEAESAGTPFCEYLQDQACVSAGGHGASGANISSTSSAGHSVSFFSPSEAPISPGAVSEFQALAADQCLVCGSQLPAGYTDADLLNCLLGRIGINAPKSFTKSYWSLRYACACAPVSSTTTPSVPSVPTDAPDAPADLDATDNIVDRVDLSWTASEGATAYEIWRGSSVSTGSMALLAETAAAIFSDTSAVLGTPYFYSLKAKNAAGTSEFALPAEGIRQVSIVSLSLSPSSVTAPPTAISTGTVTLNGVPGSALTVVLSHNAPGGLLTMPSGLQLIAVSSRTFEIVVLASQPSPVVVTVTATYQGVSVTAQLTVSA